MKTGIKVFAIIAVAAMTISSAFAEEGNVEQGATIFKKCKACHKIGDGAKNSIGPVLSNVIGRQAGTFEGYNYGKSMIAAGDAGLVWSEMLLTQYLVNPRDFLREYLDDKKAKAKMRLKVKDEQDRLDVAAYVATFSDAVDPDGEEATEPVTE